MSLPTSAEDGTIPLIMSKVKAPLSSTEASGTIGNSLTFATHSGNQVARAYSITPNPRTNLQLEAREALAKCQRLWATLSPDQADAWRLFSKAHPRKNAVGTFIPTGPNCLTSGNIIYARAGNDLYPILDPPEGRRPDNLRLVSVEVFANELIRLNWTVPEGLPEKTLVQVWLQGPYTTATRRLRKPEQNVEAFLFASNEQAFPLTSIPVGSWGFLGVGLCAPGWRPHPRWWVLFQRTAETAWYDARLDPA